MATHTLMFGWEYPPLHSGGLGVACQGLVRGLLQSGVRVTLVLPHAHGQEHDDVEFLFPTDEQLRSISVGSVLQPYDTFRTYDERILSLNLPRETSELYGEDLGDAVERFTALSVELTKKTDPDVVHCHDWMTYEAGARAARFHRKPLVAHVHATEFDRTDFHPNPWIADKERMGLKAADRIIAVSNYTKGVLTGQYGIDPGKIDVVHNGHDHTAAPAKTPVIAQALCTNPMVLFLGRLTVQKNPWQFLEVAARIKTFRPDVQFVMAGDGGMLPELVDRACEIGLGQNIVFTGKVHKREADRLFAQASCFIMPSLSEPFGLVALEAIGHGTPVVISRQSGAAEVLDHAFKVDFWDTDRFADCVLTILREKPLARQLTAEAPRVLQKLSWKNQAGHVRSIYHNLIS